MARLLGREWSRAELMAYVGDLAQVAGVKLGEWSDGAERGVRTAEVRTGSGLEFTVLLDRGMDIGPAFYRGMPLAWISPTGFGHPGFFEPEGAGWLRTFGGGLLTGCGLTYVGAPNVDEGEALGLHGRLSMLPASHVRTNEKWAGDECTLSVKGEVRQARLFGENLRLARRISAGLGQSTITVHDVVENLADVTTPLMIVYHMNIGFPMLDETSYLVAEPRSTRARDEFAAPGINDWMRFQLPTSGYHEQAFYHDLPAGPDGWAAITLVNPTRRLSLTVRYDGSTLTNLIEWKQMGRGEYVLGLEPSNCTVDGRSKERARGTLPFIEPGQRVEFSVQVQISEM